MSKKTKKKKQYQVLERLVQRMANCFDDLLVVASEDNQPDGISRLDVIKAAQGFYLSILIRMKRTQGISKEDLIQHGLEPLIWAMNNVL